MYQSFESIRQHVQGIQRILNYDNWSLEKYSLFATSRGIGRIALTSSILGILFGIHFIIWMYTTIQIIITIQPYLFTNINIDNNLVIVGQQHQQTSISSVLVVYYIPVWQWTTYICCLCIFHSLEFFITVLYNPTTATYDSFLINHSTAYTVAAISSWIEFFIIRLSILFYYYNYYYEPSSSTTTTTATVSNSNNSSTLFVVLLKVYSIISLLGIFVVSIAQLIRSVAMITAGQSFDHYIQTSRKTNHILITNGIYKYIRHPSYCGYFFWSIGTQLLLCNSLHIVLYTIVCYHFFTIRIIYEEESLCKLFTNNIYSNYVQTTYSGIPFIYTKLNINSTNTSTSAAATTTTSESTTTQHDASTTKEE